MNQKCVTATIWRYGCNVSEDMDQCKEFKDMDVALEAILWLFLSEYELISTVIAWRERSRVDKYRCHSDSSCAKETIWGLPSTNRNKRPFRRRIRYFSPSTLGSFRSLRLLGMKSDRIKENSTGPRIHRKLRSYLKIHPIKVHSKIKIFQNLT